MAIVEVPAGPQTYPDISLAKETVRRFVGADSVEELLTKPRAGQPSLLDAYKPYLHEHCNAGMLDRETTEQGYQGSRGTVAAYLAPFRALAAPPATPAVPKVHQTTLPDGAPPYRPPRCSHGLLDGKSTPTTCPSCSASSPD